MGSDALPNSNAVHKTPSSREIGVNTLAVFNTAKGNSCLVFLLLKTCSA